MKKCESFTAYASKTAAAARFSRQRERTVLTARDARRKRGDGAFRDRDLAAGPRTLHPADDDAVLRREAFRNHAQTVEEPAYTNDLLTHDTFGVDHVHDLPRLARDDRLIGHEQRVERLQRVQAQLTEHAG